MTFDEILKKTIDIEQEIYKLFIALADLEIKGLEDSETYQSKAKILETKIEEENLHFKSIVLEGAWLLELLKFFEDTKDKQKYFDASLSETDIQRIYARTYQLLIYTIDTNIVEDEIRALLPPNKEVNISNVIKYIFEEDRKLYKNYYELIFEQKTICYSLNDRLYYLQEAIEQEKDKYVKRSLQIIKYYTAYCEGMFTPSITQMLVKGPLTQIIHEQIEHDCSSLKGNIDEFLLIIDELMGEDADNYIEEILDDECEYANKKALIIQLKATLPYLSKETLETIKDTFDEMKKDIIIKVQLSEIITEEFQSRSYYNVGKSERKSNVGLQLTDHHISLIKQLLNIEYSVFKIYEQIIKLKSENKENTDEFKNWLENLKDAFELEKRILNKIPSDYEYVLQLSLAINGGNLQLYTDREIGKEELFCIRRRINSYIEPLFDSLLNKKMLAIETQDLEEELNIELQNILLIQFLQKAFMIEAYKKVEEEINASTGAIQEELIYNQFSTIFTNFHLTEMLLQNNFDCNQFLQFNSDYLYIISLELGVDYQLLEEKFYTFMYESALQFGESIKDIMEYQDDEEMQVEDGHRKGYIQFLEAQVKATLPFLTDKQLNELGYTKQKTLVK